MPALAHVLSKSLWRSLRAPPPPPTPSGLRLSAVRSALARAERLLEPPRTVLAPNVILLRPVPAPPIVLEDAPSPWDPEPRTRIVHRDRKPANAVDEEEDEYEGPRDHALVQQEILGSKTLLLELVRRAAFDWILYRSSRRLMQKLLADGAYRWLFLEHPGTADWEERQREGKACTSFEAICEALDLDPDGVRTHIKRLTPKHVTSVGRPAQYRQRTVFANSSDDTAHGLPAGMLADEEPSDEVIY